MCLSEFDYGVELYLGKCLSCWGLRLPRTCSTAIFVWPIMPWAIFLIWRQILEVNFRMEVNSGGELNIEVNFGGKFQYGGECWQYVPYN
jgi:hypothetical protein